jgi:hypothetical protein
MPFLDDPAPFALGAGAVARGVVQHRNAEGRRQVDQAMTFDPPAGLPLQRDAWDSYSLEAIGDLRIDVVAARQPWTIELPVAPVVDDIVALTVYNDLAAISPYATDATVCFAAIADGLRVAGLEWTFAGERLEPMQATPPTGGCITLLEPTEGDEIIVSAGGVERTFTARVAP